jgi:hypothetical protein
MTQYCTLQEAYNVPSFQRKKKSCRSDDKTVEDYDRYTEQKGKEQAVIEKFQNERPLNKQNLDIRKQQYSGSYSNQTQDYDYFCKTTGICALEEPFTSAAESVPSKPSNPKEQSCAKLNPPEYQYPLTEKDKAHFKKALNVAIDEIDDPKRPYTPTDRYIPKSQDMRKVNMNKVSGFIDEELESYLDINEMKSEVPRKSVGSGIRNKIPGLDDVNQNTESPLVKDIQRSSSNSNSNSNNLSIPSMMPVMENFTQKNKVWMDLLLFIASGILIIFLLEQLFKLALMTGMKKTVEALQNILEEKNK